MSNNEKNKSKSDNSKHDKSPKESELPSRVAQMWVPKKNES